MEFRRRPNVRAMEEPQSQPQRGPPPFSILKRPWPFLVTSILVIGFSCTLARLILVGKLFYHWRVGIPALCYGAIAQLDYKTLDATTAFMFSSISNAIAVTTYNETIERACHTKKYSLGNAESELNTIYIYLIAISVWDLVALIVVQGTCWYWLFTKGCRGTALLFFSLCSLMSLGFEVGSIYLGSRRGDPAILGLSVIIFTCTLVFLVLNTSVFCIQRKRGKDPRDNVKVTMPGIHEVYAIIFGKAARSSSRDAREDKPNMVMMFNPRHG